MALFPSVIQGKKGADKTLSLSRDLERRENSCWQEHSAREEHETRRHWGFLYEKRIKLMVFDDSHNVSAAQRRKKAL
jgi:hypothetical protein